MTTPESGMEWDEQAILAEVLKPKGKGGQSCWVQLAPDNVKGTMRLLEQMVADGEGERINRAQLSRTMQQIMGDAAPSREAIGRHLRGDCLCQPMS